MHSYNCEVCAILLCYDTGGKLQIEVLSFVFQIMIYICMLV